MIDEKIQKAERALRLHMRGFPDKTWKLMWDVNLQMHTIVSEDYLEEFEPDYIV